MVDVDQRPRDHVADDDEYQVGEVLEKVLVAEKYALGLARLELGQHSADVKQWSDWVSDLQSASHLQTLSER